VLKKTNQVWIWIALCRKTRQVVAYTSREIESSRPAEACGRPFHTSIVQATVLPIFGWPTKP
jgi:hypothetical protein